MKSWADIGFEIEGTNDGSLTLRLLEPNYPDAAHGESMHHSGGACAETLLIYGKPIAEILENVPKSKFLIIGLGLGYIEMVIAREALLQGKTSADIAAITSFESIPELREFFVHWVWDRSKELSAEVFKTYQHVAEFMLQETGLEVSQLKLFLQKFFPEVKSVHGALENEFNLNEKFHGILYDAFSSKTTPHLWEEEYLVRFLKNFADPKYCQFSTYACRVSLKQALIRENFEITIRPGFMGKRNSTLGTRIP